LDNITQEVLCLSDIDAIVDQDEFSITVETDTNLEDENPLSENCASAVQVLNPDEGLLDIAPSLMNIVNSLHFHTYFQQENMVSEFHVPFI